MKRRQLYVETLIQCDLDDLWRRTQEPEAHQRWDLRFTGISYLPKSDPAQPQRFRYFVRVVPGLVVSGIGVSTGERTGPRGRRTSALRFSSVHPLSLIRSGSGYWRYEPTNAGIRFLTGYDYQPGWGWLGQLVDRAFRPLLGWGTAWSFDRLRLWLERGIPPEESLRRALADTGARIVLCVAAWWAAPALFAVLVMAMALFVPPMPSSPAARRCLRRPPERRVGDRSTRVITVD